MSPDNNASAGRGYRLDNIPYGAYHQRDVPGVDDELTRTGPGTPMGEYMRRSWQPVCLSADLEDLPRAITVMGEDLVAFRDRAGRVGVLNRHCSHRGTSLEYGIIEENGIRCCYHGWQFDIDGRILDTPGEPPESRLKDSFCHGAYPAFERDGLVFAYMGPPDDKPEFPVRDPYGSERIVPFAVAMENNWLQTYENTIDPVHSTFLHTRMTGTQLADAFGELPRVEYQETTGGGGVFYISMRRLLDDRIWVRHVHTIFPNEGHFGTLFEEGGEEEYYFRRAYVSRWIVPHDDESCTIFGWRFFGDGLPGGDPGRVGRNRVDFDGQAEQPDYETKQRQPGDWEAQAGQRPIAVHALEHRGTTDFGVVMMRRGLRRAARGEAPAARPGDGGGGEFPNPHHVFAQDTMLPIAKGGDDADDMALLTEVGRRVTEIMLEADDFEGAAYEATIVENLRALAKA